MMMETVQDVLVNLMMLGIMAALAVLVACIRKAAAWASARVQQIGSQEQRELLQAALDSVEHLTVVTVSAIEQTAAKTLREAVKAGTVEWNELEALSRKAAAEIKRAISPEYQNVITANLGDFDHYLKELIEAVVLQVKTSTGPGASTSPIRS